MDVLIAILCTLPVGVAIGIWAEHRYGPKLSADNAAAHAALAKATEAVTEATDKLKGA